MNFFKVLHNLVKKNNKKSLAFNVMGKVSKKTLGYGDWWPENPVKHKPRYPNK